MAFNPFNVFRRNQKTLFAILTVFVMFMFVLSFGKGDFFEWLPRWLGSKKAGGEVMAVVDGSKLYSSELQQTHRDRVYANQFMAQANLLALRNAYNATEQAKNQASAETKQAIDFALTMHRILTGQEQSRFDTQFLPQLFGMVENQLGEILAKPNSPKEDTEAAKAARDLLRMDRGLSGQTYFINQPNQTDKDTLEFDLWLKKAGKLGIDYSAADAKTLVMREFQGRLSDDDLKSLEADFQKNKQGVTKDRLDQALADEFKVRAAQNVVMGPSGALPSGLAPQSFSSPYEEYKYFREQCVGATYGVISVPVENYASQVPGLPSEGELREIFSKYRNTEPNPASESPGLKEPRKLKLGWLEVRGDEAFYKTAAEDALKRADVQAKLAGFLTAPLGPAGFCFLAAPAPFVLGDPALQTAYGEYKSRFKVESDTSLFPTFFGTHRAVGPSLVKPANLAAAAVAAAGSLLTHGSPYTAALVFEQRAAVEERNLRARIGASFFVNPLLPGAGVGVPLGAVAAASARLPQPLPLAVVKPELLEKTKAGLARRVAEQDLTKFQEEMTRLGKNKDKAEVKAYLDGFAKARGLKVSGSQAFHDQYTIGDDPGLAPLKEKLTRGHGMTNALVQFGAEFFFEQDPRTRRFVPATTLYAPQPYPQQGMAIPGFPTPIVLREGEPTFLAWRTEELPAEAPKTLEAARDKVLAAWRESKARELAKQAAEQLAKDAETFGQQAGTVDQKLRDLHEQFKNRFAEPAKDRVKYFLIDNVCPVPPIPTFGSNMSMNREQYEPFTLRPTKDLPYPTQQILDELLKNKDKPLSTTLVFPDAGKHAYYVAVLKDHRDVGVDTFFSKVYTSQTDSLGKMVQDREKLDGLRDARADAIALLKAEFRVEKENPKLNEKSESSIE